MYVRTQSGFFVPLVAAGLSLGLQPASRKLSTVATCTAYGFSKFAECEILKYTHAHNGSGRSL